MQHSPKAYIYYVFFAQLKHIRRRLCPPVYLRAVTPKLMNKILFNLFMVLNIEGIEWILIRID